MTIAVPVSDEAAASEPGQHRAVSVLRTLVLCDLVDSTALIERMGDQRAAELFRKHDRLARSLLQKHGGLEIDKTDGFLLMFERPIQAVAFALAYQHDIAALNATESTQLATRFGIHVGDVVVWDNAADDIRRGAKPVEVEGLVKPIAARLMQLALPGQILLSGTAYDIAHRAQGELGELLAKVAWRTHGRYRFKGVPDLVPVFEVGEQGLAPLKPPPWSGKAHREMPIWRRPMGIGFELGVLALLIALPIYYLTRPSPAIAFANRDWVVVGDLKNLTSQANFDDAVQTGFRISLEQSRYVNVLSDLKVRETVKLMQRDPLSTKVDRNIGAEIAMRDGARALILPTVAEVGGRVRVTAEVVDPRTQTTVWSESVDGVGAESVLPSIDKVNEQLRERLGEALATVSENSRPLEKVATKNLDALRMYSLALEQIAKAKIPDAMSLLGEALKSDPDFASAHVQIARLLAVTGHNADALKELNLALTRHDRLTPRDALLAESHIASIESPRASVEKWKVLASAYPDFSVGTGTYAYIAWQIANRYDSEVLAAAHASASSHSPNRGPSLHLSGILDLGNERYKDAVANFEQAEAGGFAFKPYHAATLAAQRDYAAAEKLLPPLPAKFEANTTLGTMQELLRLSLPLARGDRPAAMAALVAARGITAAPGGFADALELTDLATLQPPSPEVAKRIERSLAGARQSFKPDDSSKARSGASPVLLFAWLSARGGAAAQASAALADVEKRASLADSPALANLAVVVRAQIALANGQPDAAITLLKPLLDGSELCLVHSVLLDAYLRGSDDVRALEQAEWLTAHRGRAYAEYNLDKALLPYNVAQASLASLAAAELSVKRADLVSARRYLAQFKQDFHEDGAPPAVLVRLSALQVRLSP
ncbi:MAG: putative peptide modification system cyclase [Dokdonella sp.]|uniref:putative peptide modification system cyclase n=1 Tax=Dokdonella sp. TaxID=2291710 RepID=UPI0032663340